MTGRVRAAGVVGLAMAMVMLGLAACSGSARPTPTGTLADAGFRPSPNGFPFQNYGEELSNGQAPTNLTASDVRTMFGAGVCADASIGRCDLIPEAQAWLTATNKAMAGGHCYGFSVAAELLWERKLNVQTLGAAATARLAIANNQTLQRLIAYDWTLQTLDSVQSKRITGTPNQILAVLQKVLKPNPPDTYTIAIWKPDGTGGHAVTPYAVENEGGGHFKVLIYDNNWPGATRAISFDKHANTWTYDAAINPNRPNEIYRGNAQTQTISLFPTSPGLGTQPCPFCGKVPSSPSTVGQAGASSTEEIDLVGSQTEHANVVVTDEAGHRLGYINGKLVAEIPGARVEQLISSQDWTNDLAPEFYVPANATYTITIDGTALKSPETETVGIIGPSYDLSVDGISMKPGEQDTLVAEPNATRISYTSSRSESPTLEVGLSDYRADYAFQVMGVADRPGSTITLSLPAEGHSLTVQNAGTAAASTVKLKMTRETEQGVQVFSHGAIPLAGGDSAELAFGAWTNTVQGIPLTTTHDGRRSTQTLADQASG